MPLMRSGQVMKCLTICNREVRRVSRRLVVQIMESALRGRSTAHVDLGMDAASATTDKKGSSRYVLLFRTKEIVGSGRAADTCMNLEVVCHRPVITILESVISSNKVSAIEASRVDLNM